MNIDAIEIGGHPPEDINVIVEVPVGSDLEPGKWVRWGDASEAKELIQQGIARAT